MEKLKYEDASDRLPPMAPPNMLLNANLALADDGESYRQTERVITWQCYCDWRQFLVGASWHLDSPGSLVDTERSYVLNLGPVVIARWVRYA